MCDVHARADETSSVHQQLHRQDQDLAALLACLSRLAAMPQLSDDDGEPSGWSALQASKVAFG